jgi:hypothetical protein
VIRRLVLLAILGGGVVTLLAATVAFPALRQRQHDVRAECAAEFETDKTNLSGYHWSWAPPGWVCEFDLDPRRGHPTPYERRLPLSA